MSVIATSPLSAPTNVTATPSSNGSLAAGTYYYRVVATQAGLSGSLSGPYGAILWGLPSIEVSAVADATNKTITISWDSVVNATGYLVYRTQVSGDYAPSSPHYFRDPAQTRDDMYPSTTTTSYVDDGTRTISPCLFLTNGLPYVTITGSTEQSPDTEETIYNALISASLTDHTSRIVDASGTPIQYWFRCNIKIDGWFSIGPGKSIFHEGTISLGSGSYGFSIGQKSGYPQKGSSYIRKFVYAGGSSHLLSTIKIYDSFVKDDYVDYSIGNNVAAGWSFVYGGTFICENSIVCIPALQITGDAQGSIVDTILSRSLSFMQSSAKIYMSGVQYCGVSYPLYCYYATENTVIKNARVKAPSRDMYFHKNTTSAKLDALNHQFVNDPPRAISSQNPGNLVIRRKYEFTLNVIDEKNNPLPGAKAIVVDAFGNQLVPELSDVNGNIWLTSGTATAATTSTISDSTKNWTSNALVDFILEIYQGTGNGQEKSIYSNTASQITIKGSWETPPSTDSKYRIKMQLKTHEYTGKAIDPYFDTTTFQPFTLLVTKTGYENYEKKFTTSDKIDWIINLINRREI